MALFVLTTVMIILSILASQTINAFSFSPYRLNLPNSRTNWLYSEGGGGSQLKKRPLASTHVSGSAAAAIALDMVEDVFEDAFQHSLIIKWMSAFNLVFGRRNFQTAALVKEVCW